MTRVAFKGFYLAVVCKIVSESCCSGRTEGKPPVRCFFSLAVAPWYFPLESLTGPTSKALSPNVKKQRVEAGGKLSYR